MSFHSHAKVKRSQKRRRCCWCSQIIEIGDPYDRENCIFEGDFQDNVYHPECYAVAHDPKNADHNGEFELFGEEERPFLNEGLDI